MKENFEIHNYEFFKEDTLIYRNPSRKLIQLKCIE